MQKSIVKMAPNSDWNNQRENNIEPRKLKGVCI